MTQLAEIVAELLLFAQSFTGYAPANDRPDVVFVAQAELQRQACKTPCEVFGWYPYGGKIFLDERLNPVLNIKARGVLLHELVHYLQEHNSAYEDNTPCMNWALREREAYRVQASWLARQNIFGALYSSARPPWSGVCRDEPAKTPPATDATGPG
ncbi:hypothetical protein [Pelagibius sp. Alg239-R121]|uniref:hypothetical protein n=1 Tax=Pelagibius sp. Alg239-R121 TaxID=2993448 RepID=UPI0024A64294|nr:hypothetical protein [Pelagibius sp. Alg239-R121]